MTVDLPDPHPTRAKDAALVQQMFDRVAPRYDIANAVLSLGQDQHWRRVAVRAADPRPGDSVLDVASGTGRLAEELVTAGARVVALDFSLPMLRAGRSGPRGALVGRWVNGDGTRLPFPDATFDAVTIGFGLRNLPDPEAGLAEFARVTRPGGRLAVLEFTAPAWPPFRRLYRRYLREWLPRAARLVSSDPAAYRYLVDSILAWPSQRELARVIGRAGWTDPGWRDLTGGIVAVHRARKALSD